MNYKAIRDCVFFSFADNMSYRWINSENDQMSRVASNHSVAPYTNGASSSNKSASYRSSTSSINLDPLNGRPVHIRSAAPPPVHKETVHACPLCNSEYKDPRVLPCTHTYCYQCIREKLIKNNRLTCPKCHYQVSSKIFTCSINVRRTPLMLNIVQLYDVLQLWKKGR